MTRKELQRQQAQADRLMSLGFTAEESEQLRRISMTLHRWYELECGDGNCIIERDETTNVPYMTNYGRSYVGANDPRMRYRVPDRETGAIRRLGAIVDARNKRNRVHEAVSDVLGTTAHNLSYYLQTDPRGASLYILRPGDVPDGADPGSYYSRGIVVY